MKSFLIGRVRSCRCASAGLIHILRSQRNAWIHLAATLAVITAGTVFRITSSQWLWLILAIALVWITESLNTALELLADAAVPQKHPLIALAKDTAAAAVLLAALTALAIGLIVFWPSLHILFGR